MTDTTGIILPSEAFGDSPLLLLDHESAQALIDAATAWVPGTGYRVLAILAIVSVLLVLNNFVKLAPHFFGGLFRWKEFALVDDNMGYARDRNIIAVVSFVPFCLIVYRWGLWDVRLPETFPSWMEDLAFPVCFAAYILLRHLLHKIIGLKAVSPDAWRTAANCWMNFFIVLTCIFMLTSLAGHISGINPSVIQRLCVYETGVTVALYLLQKFYFLNYGPGLFRVILYLCTHEILPLAILIATGVLF